ncbi:MAG: PCYCGC motif-containing (lipo)protein [Terriglobia bacterium]
MAIVVVGSGVVVLAVVAILFAFEQSPGPTSDGEAVDPVVGKPQTSDESLSAEQKILSELPAFANTSPKVQESYLFASMEPELLDEISCYCGCKNALRECFIKDFSDEEIQYNSHGGNCQVCMDEALLSKYLVAEGKGTEEIGQQIDSKFGGVDPPAVTGE